MGRVEGKVGLVTGGGSGIGEACAMRLAQEGAGVSVVDISATGAERVAAAIVAAGGRAVPVVARRPVEPPTDVRAAHRGASVPEAESRTV
jgi:NAD(P)-dependent dehydrogenase (short-subunit alcohol dehydrogenase family)